MSLAYCYRRDVFEIRRLWLLLSSEIFTSWGSMYFMQRDDRLIQKFIPKLAMSNRRYCSELGAMGMLTQSTVSSCVAVALVFLLCTCSVSVARAGDQTGFLNIDCGASKSYVHQATGLTWVPDAGYISTGAGINVDNIPLAKSNYSQFPEYSSLRYFSDSRAKNCYSLPVMKNSSYMLRTTFFYGNYDNALKPPSFKLVIDATVVEDVVTSSDGGVEFENHYLAQGNVTFLCLIRTSNSFTPFISGITLKPSPYVQFNYDSYSTGFSTHISEKKFMSIRTRVNFGGTDLIRFPTDPYDRYWYPEGIDSAYLNKTTSPLKNLSTTTPIGDSQYLLFERSIFPAPQAVLQTAVATEYGTFICNYLSPFKNETVALPFPILHFAELDPAANVTSRVFAIQIWPWYGPSNWPVENTFNITLSKPQGYQWDFWWFEPFASSVAGLATVFTMEPTPVSAWGPILNALEVFAISDPAVAKTVDRDVIAIENIKASLNLSQWTGDPCLPYPHPWVSCSDGAPPQISVVNLSGYQLQGAFPPSFSNLYGLTSLLLDNNKLTGSLPDLSFMTNLVALRLQNNNLSGVLPDWLAKLPHLIELSVENNNFSGAIPPALLSSNTLQFTFNPGNPLLTGGNRTSSISNSKSSSSNNGAVIGGIVGGILGVALVLAILVCLYCRKKRKGSSTSQRKGSLAEIGTSGGAKVYTLEEVVAATSNFKTEIGKGGFGPVFYGKFPDGQEVAVKVSDGSTRYGHGQSQGNKEFFNEVDVLSRVRHKNLVALVGYCQEDRKQILIYEYMHNGSLHDQLRGKTVGVFDWKTRLHIALCAAQGLEYLHAGCSPSFIHRDIKSSNILISARRDAKVADFGLTKLMGEDDPSHVTTFVKGTAGYLDPEYCNTELLSTKSDIYSFGVVLLELLTGRPPIDRSGGENSKPNVCDWARSTLELGNIDAILAPEVRASRPRPNQEALWKLAEIALQCVEPQSIHRPTMTVVLQELQQAASMEEASSPSPIESYGVFDFSGGSDMTPMAR